MGVDNLDSRSMDARELQVGRWAGRQIVFLLVFITFVLVFVAFLLVFIAFL